MAHKSISLYPCLIFMLWFAVAAGGAVAETDNESLVDPDGTFCDNVLKLLSVPSSSRKGDYDKLLAAHPVQCDWICQDTGADIASFMNSENPGNVLDAVISRILVEAGGSVTAEFERLKSSQRDIRKLLELYVGICEPRRAKRLKNIRAKYPHIVFLKNIEHGNAPRAPMSISTGPYKGLPFSPGSSICLLDMSDLYGVVTPLLEDKTGMLRDVDVSIDGERILFVWKKSALGDDYHLYEMTVKDKSIRQITSEQGVADVQGRYVGDGIVYHSSRCVNVVVCNETIDTVNMYSCDMDGGNIRRLGYDQVSTQYPSVLADGRIIYTRWEYNDRGQIYPQGLFVMNPDGTGQSAIYGNNSYYPTSLIQARGVPNSNKLIAVLSGHHAPPCGKLALIDLTKGQDEGEGVTLVAPERPAKYERVDSAGQNDVLFQYPYPLSEDEYLVSFSLFGKKRSQKFGIYYMRSDGVRELLAWDEFSSCRQPIPLVARRAPKRRPTIAASGKETGVFYVDNIYAGEGLKGIKPGTVKRLRVIGLDFRAAAVGISYNNGPAGNARVDTPISIGGSWDVKVVLGDAEVYEDGSASFIVPARLPVYFQAIDEKGRAVQSMRSWSTLQPGETFSCVGCHQSRNRTSAASRPKTIAQLEGPKELEPFYGPARGFSFLKEIQPILNRHCVRCHEDEQYRPPVASNKKQESSSLFCFWPAQYSRTNTKQALYHLGDEQDVGKVSVRWVSQGVGKVSNPRAWRLYYRNGGDWTRLAGKSDARNIVLEPSVKTDALMIEAEMADKTAGGIEEWRVYDLKGREIRGDGRRATFNLSQRKVYEDLSGRAWAQSYLSLLRSSFRKQGNVGYHLTAYPNEYVNWISPQSGPKVMVPYSFGAAASGLIAMLDKGHEKVALSKEEKDKLACWIDLAVPYCGDYQESNIWTEENIRDYNSRVAERVRLSQLEIR